jgi:hypothetical protein
VEVVAPSYQGFRFPVEIISHCVWLYHRFPLSLREVEEMMLERGVVVTYETIRAWWPSSPEAATRRQVLCSCWSQRFSMTPEEGIHALMSLESQARDQR